MTQIDNAPRQPEENELPKNYDELVSIGNLKRDHLNVRNEDPRPRLIKNISKNGIENALITREDPQNPSEYFVTDGWQRYQCACEVGFTHVPIDIFKSRKQATKKAEIHSLGKAWDDIADYNQDFIRIQKVFIEEEGLNEKEAIDKRTEEREVTKNTVKKNYRIAQLPPKSKQLLKEPEERDDGFHDDWKVKGYIGKKNGSLNKENAHLIAKRFLNNDLDESETFKFAMRSTRNPDIDILKEGLSKYIYNGKSVKEAFNQAKDEVVSKRNKTNFNIGMINLTEDEKEILSRYISHEKNMQLRQYFYQVVVEEKDRMLDKINKDKYLNNSWTIDDSKDNIKR